MGRLNVEIGARRVHPGMFPHAWDTQIDRQVAYLREYAVGRRLLCDSPALRAFWAKVLVWRTTLCDYVARGAPEDHRGARLDERSSSTRRATAAGAGPRLRGTNDNVADVIFIDVSGRVVKRLLAFWRAPSVELGITSNHDWLHLISISGPIRGCLPDLRSNEPMSLPLTPIHASTHSECLLTC
ncbi:MAG: hypothetical protein QOF88_7304 [Mycobacterium sp.]|nr:hypothetical protein [Mycobacterium sp.]